MDPALANVTPQPAAHPATGIVVLDPSGLVLTLDAAACALLDSDSPGNSADLAACLQMPQQALDDHLLQARQTGQCSWSCQGRLGSPLHVELESSARHPVLLLKLRALASGAPLPLEEDFRLAFHCAGTGLALLRISGEWIAANPMICQMLGYSEAELRQTSFQSLTHPDDVLAGREGLPELLHGQTSRLTLEKRYIRKNGSVLWARLTLGVVRRNDGRPLYYVSQLEDISEIHSLRQALLNTEQKYRTLAQNTQNIIVRYNRDGQQIYANHEFEQTRGFPAPDSKHHPDYVAQLQQVMASGQATTLLQTCRDPLSGRDIDFMCNLVPEYDQAANVCGVLVSAQDISQRRRLEQAEQARSVVFQNMATGGALADIVPHLGAYLDALVPEHRNVIVLTPGTGAEEHEIPPPDLTSLQDCLALDVRQYPEHFNQRRMLNDLRSDASMLHILSPALLCGYHSCWLEPVVNSSDAVVGAIALFSNAASGMSEQDIQQAQVVSHIAAVAWQRSSALESLAQSERRYREVFDYSQDMMCLLSIDASSQLHCLEANPMLCKRLGKPHMELIGQPLEQMIATPAAQVVEAICQHCIAVAAPIELDAHLPCDDRSLFIHFNLIPIGNANGQMHRLVCIARDITDLREVQRKERERQHEIGALVENSPDGIARLSPKAELLFINPALEKWLNQSKADVLHKELKQVLPAGLQTELFQAAVILAAETGQPQEHEYLFSDTQRLPRVYHISLVPETDAQKRIVTVLAMVRDISQLRVAQQRLASLNNQLRNLMSSRESAREEERKLIAQEIHDELGQHLSAIRMGTSLLRFKYGEQLPELAQQIGPLLQLIDQTVQVVRNVATSLRPSILNMGLAAALEWLADEFRRQWSIACELQIPSHPLRLDDASATAAFRIAQESLTNIARHAEASRVKIRFEQTQEHWTLEITDNGKGFDQRQQSGKTLGLLGMRERGLTLGGITTITSLAGNGTQVHLRVPTPNKEAP
ncbi:PAS domain S-box protein [Pseudomonas protegens]|uniref:PAS domain S-box protein n=1 Tax=Pseudomonas protegens TaxID=380021 RepID=UPI0039068336